MQTLAESKTERKRDESSRGATMHHARWSRKKRYVSEYQVSFLRGRVEGERVDCRGVFTGTEHVRQFQANGGTK